ncbi:MAG: tetratricopeptide repeat protein [Candidatus Helarchaeota archaeon]
MNASEKAHSQSVEDLDVTKKIEAYRKKLQTDPNDLSALSNLGSCYALLNKFDEAQKLFNQILELDPKNLDGLNNLGVVYTQIGKLDEGISKLEIAVKLDPENTKLWNNLSEAYRRAGHYHKANVSRMRAIQLTEKE